MDTFVFAKSLPNNSIINPAVAEKDYLDKSAPFSFFDFLKYTKETLSPIQTNDLYVNYVKQWNIEKASSESVIQDSIRDRYVELIKEITLKYTTSEEKRFLANIDYNDPLDLDIVIPFYSKKIREVCAFYAQKRENIKYKVFKNKSKGTSNSIEKSIFETITDTLFSDVLDVSTYQRSVNQDNLLANLNIEVEELYDLYTNYLDNDPDASYSDYDITDSFRQELYSANINSIDGNIFINIDKAIQAQIFENINVFLEEFGKNFTINYDLNAVNLNCKTGDPLASLVLDNKDSATREVELRNKLIRKYIGSDFYYIETGTTITDVVSAKLFSADNPSGNLLNRHFPSTASVEENELYSMRRIGLFFTPDKTGILYFSVPDKKYKIDNTKLEPNKLYIFPDPERYGNTTGLSRTFNLEYPLIHIQDYSKSVKQVDSFTAEGDINSNPFTQSFYAYYSSNQISNNTFGNDGLDNNLSRLSDLGVMSRWCTDIYGNQYGLIKPKSRKELVDNTITVNSQRTVLDIYDGGPIMFNSGQLLPEASYSQQASWVTPNVFASNYYYNVLIDCGIGGIVNGIMERGQYSRLVVDGRGIINPSPITFDLILNQLSGNDSNIIDGLQFSSNSFTWNINPISGMNSSYSFIIDGNLYDNYPSNFYDALKTLDGNGGTNYSSYTPDATLQYQISSIKYREFDGGGIIETYDEIYDFNEQEKFIVQQTVNSCNTIFISSDTDDGYNSNDLRNLTGRIYVRNVVTGVVSSLSSHLSVQFDKYPDAVVDEIYNSVLDFNIFNDVIWIRTTNYLVIEKILYEINEFLYSGTTNNYIDASNQPLLNVSVPFFFENREYGMISTVELSASESNAFYIVPSIYKFNYKTATITKLYPISNLSAFVNTVSSNPVKLTKVNPPSLTYNERNQKYSVMTILEDQNEYPYIHNFLYEYNGSDILEEDIRLYNSSAQQAMTLNVFDSNIVLSGDLIYNNVLNLPITVDTDSGNLIFN